jgi:anti-anti-sigma factor
MRIDVEERGGVTVIRPEDRLDILGYLELEERLGTLLAQGRNRQVLDLQEATFINSATLAVISRFWADCARAGGVLVIARPSREALNFLRLGEADELISIFPTIEEAVAAAARRGSEAREPDSGAPHGSSGT